MHSKPVFSYYLSDLENPAGPLDPLWEMPLPMKRTEFTGSLEAGTKPAITYGDYFKEAADFLSNDNYAPLIQAVYLSRKNFIGRKNIKPQDIDHVWIFLVKHGQFYHPSKIELTCSNIKYRFVLNVAATKAGKALLNNEFFNLNKLSKEIPLDFLPRVFAGSQGIGASSCFLKMFIGEWLDDFHEFHFSRLRPDEKERIVLWNFEAENTVFSIEQTRAVFYHAAMILTTYYNPLSHEQIFPWHHAAGDFVVRLQNNQVKVKLITVRGYKALFHIQNSDEDQSTKELEILDGVLLFFLNLSIRMRFDRIDGVNDLIWVDQLSLDDVVPGFFAGLSLSCLAHRVDPELPSFFKEYYLSHSIAELEKLVDLIMEIYHPNAPELPLIRQNLEDHLTWLSKSIKAYKIKN